MKISSGRMVMNAIAFAGSAALGRAHPGHEGHELTWDLSHLAQHPLATTGCVAVAGAALFLLVQSMRRRGPARFQSFRGSQASRGK